MSFSATFRRLNAWWQAALRGPDDLSAESDGEASLVDTAFLRRLDRLALLTRRQLRGDNIGPRPSWRRIPANDFRDQRQYQPGDDLRHVDWNASARAEHVYVKLGERPKEATIHVLLDSTASMQWGNPSKLWAARRLAAALGFVALNNGDRLFVTDTAGQGAPFGPKLGKGHVPGLLRYLRGLPVQTTADLPAAGRRLAAEHARGGYAILISDLADVESLDPLLDHWRAPAWQVLVLHLLHPAELVPTLRGEIELHDAETGARANYDLTPEALARYHAFVAEWCAAHERACLARGAAYARVLADWPLEPAVLPYLRQRGLIDSQLGSAG